MTGGRRPTRATVEGRAYLDLQNLAPASDATDELHQLYALEGFLTRLGQSPYARRLLLKGSVLLAAYDARRPTRDVDVQAREIAGGRDDVLHSSATSRLEPSTTDSSSTPTQRPQKSSGTMMSTAASALR